MQIFVEMFQGPIRSVCVDPSLTIVDLKSWLSDMEFVPKELQIMRKGTFVLTQGTLEDNNVVEQDVLSVNLPVMGGTRYKKSSSCMRWKWEKKRTRRLQRRRRKMRMRAK